MRFACLTTRCQIHSQQYKNLNISWTQLLKTVAYARLCQHTTSPGSYNQDVFLFDWQELLLGIKALYYLSCLCQIGIDWCHLLSATARSEYTLPCVLWACCWHWLLSVYRGSVRRFMSVIDSRVRIKACNYHNTLLSPVCTHVWRPCKAVICTCAMWNDFQYSAPLRWLIPSLSFTLVPVHLCLRSHFSFPHYLHTFFLPRRPQRPLHLEKKACWQGLFFLILAHSGVPIRGFDSWFWCQNLKVVS